LVTYDDYNGALNVIVENKNGDFMRYINKPFKFDYVDRAIDKFIIECRKEKLKKLYEIY
jgi:hypothetical protein